MLFNSTHNIVNFKMRVFLLILISSTGFSQTYEPFQGKLVYSIEMADTSLQKYFPTKTMVVYTNDTIVRIENETKQMGKQIVIKHTVLNKSILLLQNGDQKFAIQTDLSKEKNSKNDSIKQKYIYKKKLGKRKIVGLKANRMDVSLQGQKNSIEILYLKHTSPKYVDAYEGIPGLPVRYYIKTEDGIVVYTLIYMDRVVVNRDLLGVPSDYKRVTFDQFLEEMMKSKN